jgi:hypothetical protein
MGIMLFSEGLAKEWMLFLQLKTAVKWLATDLHSHNK